MLYTHLYEHTYPHPKCLADEVGWRCFFIFLSEAQVKVNKQHDNYNAVFVFVNVGATKKKVEKGWSSF